MKYSVVIPCAGKGRRMGLDENKIFQYIGTKMIIERAVSEFVMDPECMQIILVHSIEDEERIKKIFRGEKFYFTIGGEERLNSVYAGLQIVSESIVLIHDGARPYVTSSCIHSVLQALETNKAAICGVRVKDTIKIVKDGVIVETPARENLWQAQTPQGFDTDLLLRVYEKALVNQVKATDDASLVEMLSSEKVKMIEGEYSNIKITTMEDLGK